MQSAEGVNSILRDGINHAGDMFEVGFFMKTCKFSQEF